MSILDRRWVRITVTAGVAAGLVAVTSIDVVVAQQRREHDRKVAAARALHRAESHYLDGVRTIAGQVFNVLQPYEQVIDELDSDPTTIYSARDAFAGAASAKRLGDLVRRLDELSVPPTMGSHQAKLRAALKGYVAHLMAVRKQAHVTNNEKLYDAIDNDFQLQFESDGTNWQLALQDTFAVHLDGPPKTPAAGEKAPATLVTWVFRADHACDRSFEQVGAALVRFEKRTETPADFGLVGRSLQSFTAAMRKVPLPAEQRAALRRDVMGRLPVVDASARALAAFTHALETHDSDEVQAALRKILAAGTAVKPLVAAFQSRGVTICGALLRDMVQIDEPTDHGGSLSA
jgi:hypothetical protein